MPFGFVDVQHYSGLGGEGWVDVFQTIGDILMYRRLGNSKPSGCLAHGSVVVDNVIRNSNGPFFNVWNDYMGPMIYLNSTELKTIQLGLRMFITQYSADYNLIMAAALISLIPVGALFLSMQRFFIEGVATSGLKG